MKLITIGIIIITLFSKVKPYLKTLKNRDRVETKM